MFYELNSSSTSLSYQGKIIKLNERNQAQRVKSNSKSEIKLKKLNQAQRDKLQAQRNK